MAAVDNKQMKVVQPSIDWTCKRLGEFRQARGVTITDLGRKLGISHGRVSDTESARYGDIKLSTLFRYCSALGVTIDQLFDGMPPIPKLPKPDAK